MSAPPTRNGAEHEAVSFDGVWLTDREPGELLGARRVVVHVRDSDPIVFDEVASRQEAIAIAERVVEAIARATTKGEWAEIDERMVRPEAIVSVDVEFAE